MPLKQRGNRPVKGIEPARDLFGEKHDILVLRAEYDAVPVERDEIFS
jgi:hypothetical protein